MELVLAAFVTAAVGAWGTWYNSRKARKIVEGNGHGNVADMSALLLQKAEDTNGLLTRMSVSFADHVVQDAVTAEDINKRLGSIEGRLP